MKWEVWGSRPCDSRCTTPSPWMPPFASGSGLSTPRPLYHSIALNAAVRFRQWSEHTAVAVPLHRPECRRSLPAVIWAHRGRCTTPSPWMPPFASGSDLSTPRPLYHSIALNAAVRFRQWSEHTAVAVPLHRPECRRSLPAVIWAHRGRCTTPSPWMPPFASGSDLSTPRPLYHSIALNAAVRFRQWSEHTAAAVPLHRPECRRSLPAVVWAHRGRCTTPSPWMPPFASGSDLSTPRPLYHSIALNAAVRFRQWSEHTAAAVPLHRPECRRSLPAVIWAHRGRCTTPSPWMPPFASGSDLSTPRPLYHSIALNAAVRFRQWSEHTAAAVPLHRPECRRSLPAVVWAHRGRCSTPSPWIPPFASGSGLSTPRPLYHSIALNAAVRFRQWSEHTAVAVPLHRPECRRSLPAVIWAHRGRCTTPSPWMPPFASGSDLSTPRPLYHSIALNAAVRFRQWSEHTAVAVPLHRPECRRSLPAVIWAHRGRCTTPSPWMPPFASGSDLSTPRPLYHSIALNAAVRFRQWSEHTAVAVPLHRPECRRSLPAVIWAHRGRCTTPSPWMPPFASGSDLSTPRSLYHSIALNAAVRFRQWSEHTAVAVPLHRPECRRSLPAVIWAHRGRCTTPSPWMPPFASGSDLSTPRSLYHSIALNAAVRFRQWSEHTAAAVPLHRPECRRSLPAVVWAHRGRCTTPSPWMPPFASGSDLSTPRPLYHSIALNAAVRFRQWSEHTAVAVPLHRPECRRSLPAVIWAHRGRCTTPSPWMPPFASGSDLSTPRPLYHSIALNAAVRFRQWSEHTAAAVPLHRPECRRSLPAVVWAHRGRCTTPSPWMPPFASGSGLSTPRPLYHSIALNAAVRFRQWSEHTAAAVPLHRPECRRSLPAVVWAHRGRCTTPSPWMPPFASGSGLSTPRPLYHSIALNAAVRFRQWSELTAVAVPLHRPECRRSLPAVVWAHRGRCTTPSPWMPPFASGSGLSTPRPLYHSIALNAAVRFRQWSEHTAAAVPLHRPECRRSLPAVVWAHRGRCDGNSTQPPVSEPKSN